MAFLICDALGVTDPGQVTASVSRLYFCDLSRECQAGRKAVTSTGLCAFLGPARRPGKGGAFLGWSPPYRRSPGALGGQIAVGGQGLVWLRLFLDAMQAVLCYRFR